MLGETLRTAVQDWKKKTGVSDPSFKLICLLSLFGLVISLLFVDPFGSEFDVGLTPIQLR